MFRLPYKIRWENSVFLITTFTLTLTALPIYLWYNGLSLFQFALFFFFFIATGLSITLGYHRFFSHLTFQAGWAVKAFTLLFGAAAFEGSALTWSADHRRHHKFVDHDDDPYSINRGFWHAHIGWLLFRTSPETPLTWVRDLQKDRLAVLQHKYYVPLAFAAGFGLPTLIGFVWGGWTTALGSLLMAGVARTVFVHHMTFCINSLCHWIGDQPYSSKCTARDSLLMAFFTFGEGYHNFHHEFQYDYRNGVKPWQFDPTKWTIWLLSKVGLAKRLRTVPEEVIVKAQITEQQARLEAALSAQPAPLAESVHSVIATAQARLQTALAHWEHLLAQHRAAAELSRAHRRELKIQVEEAYAHLRQAVRDWVEAHHAVLASPMPA
ncbi:fatty acid desaturase [soil metagenome]